MKRIALLSFVFLAGCSASPGHDKTVAGAMLGAGWGAGAGAVVGNQIGETGPGAAVGAGFGLVAGMSEGLSYDALEEGELKQRRELNELRARVEDSQRSISVIQANLDSREQKLAAMKQTTEVYFDAGQVALHPGSVTRLERFAETVKLSPYVGMVEIHGHSDDTGDEANNVILSEQRAGYVKNFLISKGVSADQITMFTHGASEMLVADSDQASRHLNRRVELVLTK